LRALGILFAPTQRVASVHLVNRLIAWPRCPPSSHARTEGPACQEREIRLLRSP
jgi:hypothetical protein